MSGHLALGNLAMNEWKMEKMVKMRKETFLANKQRVVIWLWAIWR